MTKEWDCRREQIVELSKVHGMTVRELQARMSKLYNFDASVRSYKRVLARWGIHIHRQRFISPRTEEAAARTATGDVSKALDELVAQLFYARQSDKDSLAQIEANFGLRLSKRALHYRRKRLSLKRAISKAQDSPDFHHHLTSSSPSALHLSQQHFSNPLSSAPQSQSQEQQNIPLLAHSSLLSAEASPPSSSSSHPNSVSLSETRPPSRTVLDSHSSAIASSPSNAHPHPLPMIPSYSSNYPAAPDPSSSSHHPSNGASIPSLPYLQNPSVFHPPGPLHPSQFSFPHHLPTPPPPPPHTPLPFLFHSKNQSSQPHSINYPPQNQNYSSSLAPAPVPHVPSENLSDPSITTTDSSSSYPSSRLPPSNPYYSNHLSVPSYPEQAHSNQQSVSAMNVVSLPPYSSFPSSSSLPPLSSFPQQAHCHIPSSPVEAAGEHMSTHPVNPPMPSIYANYIGDSPENRKSSFSQPYVPTSEEGHPLHPSHQPPLSHSPMLAAASEHKASMPSSFIGGPQFQASKSPNLRPPRLEVPESSIREPFLEPIDKEVKPSEEMLNSIQYQIGESHRGSSYLPMLTIPNAAAPHHSLPPPNAYIQEHMASPNHHAQHAMPMQNYSSVQYQPMLPSNDIIHSPAQLASSQQSTLPEENSAQYAMSNNYMGRFPQTSHHPSANLLDASASLNPVQNPLIMLHHANQEYISLGRPEHSIPEQSHIVPTYSDVDSRFV
ncbi:hypothetical protein SPOG_03681 [Schizosaccharomyces cryophilus OY26]|uniref:Clr5 domain-containing protein n=1 Tax=Schizosaccharomyces cryophilus (strain OY26 / ATCC MYA-4695 / CBS 11777 / NBRC 106824 / NRRL Y48691) TaxID=653667 RepID=S9X7Q0_SCHCR|nr:uncharacterized protein SPOG_03681 [Schizosaccharomyces cryophilus OY26]EPY53142.1 hypothetical protein SPOG_03681 [Schizosaccharomyces cryophilus OY26]